MPALRAGTRSASRGARRGDPCRSERLISPSSFSSAARWSRRGFVWVPIPGPGSYYVRVMLNDSTGRRTDGPRTEDFTIQ